ncbi:MAG: TipAS antibiotic-recognition domain-containing protein [Rhodobacteraceae bacterium]|nr:TipAS antibiotic-recognition domain-containing protein [Paracoccaceae bacterium]
MLRIESMLTSNTAVAIAANATENAALVDSNHRWVSGMWGSDCTADAHVGLAQMYDSHSDFHAQ